MILKKFLLGLLATGSIFAVTNSMAGPVVPIMSWDKKITITNIKPDNKGTFSADINWNNATDSLQHAIYYDISVIPVTGAMNFGRKVHLAPNHTNWPMLKPNTKYLVTVRANDSYTALFATTSFRIVG